MSPFLQNSQQRATDQTEGFRHPAVFRFGEVSPVDDAPVASGFAALDSALNGGWPTARLIEVLCDRIGVGELSLLLSVMPKQATSRAQPPCAESNAAHKRANASNSSINIDKNAQRSLWILPRTSQTAHAPCVAYAPALEAHGIDLRRFAIAQTSSNQETLWAMEQALLSNAVRRVLAWIVDRSQAEPHDFTLRRISLAARKSESLCFLMRPLSAARRSSPCELRIAIAPAARGEIEITVLKQRGLLQEKRVRIDPRELACLAPHRGPIVLPHVVSTARHLSLDTPPKIRERSFIIER